MLVQLYDERYVGSLIDAYIEAYDCSGMTAEEVFEEILCDSVAEINAFGQNKVAQEFQQRVKETVERGIARKVEARGPPAEGKASRESKRKYWYPKLTNAEWNLLNHSMHAEIKTSENYIDNITNWLYADSKGIH